METEMPSIVPIAEPVPSIAMSTPHMPSFEAAVNPAWKPLSAPPKMMVVSPQLKATESPTMEVQELEDSKKVNGLQELKGGRSRGQMTLSSMAKSIALSTSERDEEPCPITPETHVRHILCSGLEEALAMVSPVDSPSPSTYPSMLSLTNMELAAPPSLQAPPLLPLEPVDSRMGSFQEGIQALLASDLNDFDVDHNIFMDNQEFTTEYALDPLFMLDDVVGATV
jgi:hypothetical protein